MKKDRKIYMVIGVGRFGAAVAEELYNTGHEVIIMDEDEDAVKAASECATHFATADARNIEALRAAGASECDTAVVAMGEDLAASVLITMNLKELGVRYVLCKAKNEQYRRVLKRIGANDAIIPEQRMGRSVAQNLVSGSFLDYMELSEDYGIAEIRAPKAWAGKSLLELNVRKKYGISILMIKGAAEAKDIPTPGAEDRIIPGGKLVVMGRNEAIARLQNL